MQINRNTLKISVIGGSKCDEKVFSQAYEIGRGIAENGAMLICGGLSGVMEATCKGAKDAGGITLGIIPGDDEKSSNKYVDLIIPTGLGFARNILVVKTGHAIIAIDGSHGTLSEIAYALTYDKPLIGLNTWKMQPFCNDAEHVPAIIVAKTPKEAVALAILKAKEVLKNRV